MFERTTYVPEWSIVLVWVAIFAIGAIVYVAQFCFVPMAMAQGGYEFGYFAYWQLPLIVCVAAFIVFRTKAWRRRRRWRLIVFAYLLPVVVTNFWAVSHRVDHSNDFPRSRHIEQIPWRTPPTYRELVLVLGEPVAHERVSRGDPRLPSGVRDAMAERSHEEAIVVVYEETAWGVRRQDYVLFDPATERAFTAVGFSDGPKRTRPARWPDPKWKPENGDAAGGVGGDG